MDANYNRSRILVLVFACLLLLTPLPARAFVMSLGGSPENPAAALNSAADVLYATDRDGREVRIVGTDSSLLEGTPLDLGMPSVAPDGTVFFAAAFRRNDRVRWEIFAANPDDQSVSRVALSGSPSALEMVTDPTPMAQSDGSIVFAARDIARGDGLYRLKDGKLSCLVRVGAKLDGNVLQNIAFGSFSAASAGATAFTGYLTPVGKAELLVTDGKVIVLATVGAKAPGGARYRELGPPALGDGLVVFPAVTDRGEGVYAYQQGKVDAILTKGSPCSCGKVTYISKDRAGINSDGIVAVSATCSRVPSILMVKDSKTTMLVSAPFTHDQTGFLELGTPSLLDDGTALFGARKTDGDEGLYSVHASLDPSVTIGLVRPLVVEAGPIALHLHSILSVSVASNEQGRIAYLGGPVESFASVPTE